MEKLDGFYSSLSRVKAIHFDMDGSLIDSRNAWLDSEVELLQGYGVDLTSEEIREITHDDLIGRGQWFAAKFYKENFALTDPVEKIREKRIRLVKEYYGEAPLLPGAKDFVRAAGESSLKVTLATSAPMELAEIFLKKHGFEKYFDGVVSDDQVSQSKPSPDIFLEAARSVGVEPEESLVVEDSKNGLLAAKAAGALCLLIPNDEFSPDRGGNLSQANFVARSMASLDLRQFKRIVG